MAKRIFISYSRKNQYIADRLIVDLQRAGCEPWFDQHDIELNDEWEKAIEKAILDHDYFLYLWSPEAQESRYVQKEYELALRHLEQSKIGIARVAGNSTDMPDELRKRHHLDLGNDYWKGLAQLLERLDVEEKELVSFHDLMTSGADVRSAAAELRDKERRTWSVYDSKPDSASLPRKFLRVPIEPKGYAASWLVAEDTQQMRLQNDIYVVLKFSGPRDRDTVQEVLDYLIERDSQSQSPTQIIYIEGPQNARADRYEIANATPHVWKDCVDLAVKVISKYCRGKTAHFFLDSPQTIVFPIASRLREMFPYHIYNLDRTQSAGKRYVCVYSGQPS